MKIKINIEKEVKIGELYVDPKTGLEYECVSVYTDSNGNSEYDWKLTSPIPKVFPDFKQESTVEIVKEPEIESEKISEGKVSENISEKAKDIMNKVNPSGNNFKPHKTKYTNYSKK